VRRRRLLPSASAVTDGPDLAERQLKTVAAVSGGAVEVLDTQDTGESGRWFTISMDTSGLPAGPGIRVRDRERFRILAGPKYPYQPPAVRVPHRRWAKSAHVQWGTSLCLYAAPSVEWVPSDGMDGFIERLSAWVARAAEGTLDPDEQPLHPPVAYPTAGAGVVVVHPDIGDRAPWAARNQAVGPGAAQIQAATVVAWCAISGDRVDVLEWTDWLGAYDRVLVEGFSPFHEGRPMVVMPALLIGNELGFEYPDKAWDLATALKEAGFGLDDILTALANAIVVNRFLCSTQVQADPDAAGRPVGSGPGEDEPGAPLLTALFVGTPSRRVDDVRLTHLAAWNLESIGSLLVGAYADFRRKPDDGELLARVGEITRDWLREADVTWMRVLESRPEITRRRDEGSPSGWLAGKRILVLGCGALGAPAAEACTRAAASLRLVDNGLVTPGILVRQPYHDADVGQPKAPSLAARLARIGTGSAVEGCYANALDDLLAPDRDMSRFDLIIDATADAGVRSAIEGKRRAGGMPWPPLVTMIIGHDAARGLVTVSMPGSTGAGGSALRQVALNALASPAEWADIADDFFPAEPRTERFFPEPGCSAPTFTGGYAQTSALAGLLLNEALLVLGEHADHGAARCTAGFASAVRIGVAAAARGTSRTQWGPDIVTVDDSFGYEVRLSSAAVTEMRTEVRRGARVRGPRVETGGMLLGAIDDAAGVIYVDRVTGPPPDSFLSAAYFQHGRAGTQEAVDARQAASRAMTGFVGYWHTHPGGVAAPSPTDQEGMASIVAPDGRHQRALMVILAGPADQWDRWVAGEETELAASARLVPRAEPADSSGGGVLLTQALPPGPYFRGGFSGLAAAAEGRGPDRQGPYRLTGQGRRWPWRRQ
jgi:integrative and conjugative element protein (TIGR02256 family)